MPDEPLAWRAPLLAGALCFLGIALFLTWLALTRLFESYVNESYYRELQAVSDTIAAGIRVDAERFGFAAGAGRPPFPDSGRRPLLASHWPGGWIAAFAFALGS